MENWKPVDTAPNQVAVMTKIDDADGTRNESPLRRNGNLWWITDGSMYVYYRPTHWRELTEEERRSDYDWNRAEWLAKEPKP